LRQRKLKNLKCGRAIDIVLETKKAGDLQAQEEPTFKKLKAGAKERRIKGLKVSTGSSQRSYMISPRNVHIQKQR
jgi:hypothetical protein